MFKSLEAWDTYQTLSWGDCLTYRLKIGASAKKKLLRLTTKIDIPDERFNWWHHGTHPALHQKKNEGILRSFSKWSNHFGLWHLEKKRQQENSQWDQQLIIHLTGLSGGSPQSQSAGIISLPTGEWSNPSMVWEVAIWQPSGSTSCFKICPFLWEWPIYII